MRNNNGTETKKITLIIPKSTEILDASLYWSRENGQKVKTMVLMADDILIDGNEIYCCGLEEEGK